MKSNNWAEHFFTVIGRHLQLAKPKFTHDWEDVSYHGSAIYVCRFCNVYKSRCESDECLSAEAILTKEVEDKEQKEKWEYDKLKREYERSVYLQIKYGMFNFLRTKNKLKEREDEELSS